jgi:hypothetical protein
MQLDKSRKRDRAGARQGPRQIQEQIRTCRAAEGGGEDGGMRHAVAEVARWTAGLDDRPRARLPECPHCHLTGTERPARRTQRRLARRQRERNLDGAREPVGSRKAIGRRGPRVAAGRARSAVVGTAEAGTVDAVWTWLPSTTTTTIAEFGTLSFTTVAAPT